METDSRHDETKNSSIRYSEKQKDSYIPKVRHEIGVLYKFFFPLLFITVGPLIYQMFTITTKISELAAAAKSNEGLKNTLVHHEQAFSKLNDSISIIENSQQNIESNFKQLSNEEDKTDDKLHKINNDILTLKIGVKNIQESLNEQKKLTERVLFSAKKNVKGKVTPLKPTEVDNIDEVEQYYRAMKEMEGSTVVEDPESAANKSKQNRTQNKLANID